MAKITLGGQECETNGELPELGSQVIDFTLLDGELQPKGLAEYSGWKKLLNIFPSVDTDVCAAALRQFNAKLNKRDDLIVLNISMDLPFAQKRFCQAEQLKNAVTLSGFNSDFAESYGVKVVSGPFSGLCARAVLILDENNIVLYRELVPEIGQEPDYEAALAVLER